MARVRSLCRWLIAEEDINPAESGLFSRDLQIDGQPQRHFGLQVLGTFDASLSLGMVAIRCERKKGVMYPLAVALVDSPPVQERHPAMDLTLLSAPVRVESAEDRYTD